MPTKFIITITPELEKSAFRELTGVAADARKVHDFRNGLLLVETETPYEILIEELVRTDPVFVKHIMPAKMEVKLSGLKSADLPALLEGTKRISTLATGQEFSVQCRRVGTGFDYDSKDVEVFIGSYYEADGAVPVFSDVSVRANDHLNVVSLFLHSDCGYIGYSTVRQNLNEHCDEYRVFSRQARCVSRAEFKLMEALRKFRIDIPAGVALDLGAAPGGWTKVLVDAGMEVVAIDPAELDEKITRLPGVTHVKTKAQDYRSERRFDLIVNDMNIEPEESAKMMVEMAPYLKPDAYGVMTVKLVVLNTGRLVGNAVSILVEAFEILRMKNLFHNRREVTMLLRKKRNSIGADDSPFA